MCFNTVLSDNQCWNYNLQKELVQYIHFWSSYDKFCVIFGCQFWPKILLKNANFGQILALQGLVISIDWLDLVFKTYASTVLQRN